ncbi:copper chaperone PCu(A)C [beta proteobacterium MWH-UniP1]
MKKLLTTLAATAMLSLLPAAHAAKFTKGPLVIEDPVAMPSAPGQPHGAIFIEEIRNSGKTADELVGARSAVSKTMEVHRMVMDNNVMKMREIPGIPVPANGKVTMKRGSPDGYHLMLMNLNKPLKEGEKFPVTLIFKNAGEQEVTVEVKKLQQGMGHSGPMKH